MQGWFNDGLHLFVDVCVLMGFNQLGLKCALLALVLGLVFLSMISKGPRRLVALPMLGGRKALPSRRSLSTMHSVLTVKPSVALEAGVGPLVEKVAIVITTSASSQDPSTARLEAVISSLSIMPELLGCQLIIVCDWPAHAANSDHKGGLLRTEELPRYKEYIKNDI